jgi:hypothetical protein
MSSSGDVSVAILASSNAQLFDILSVHCGRRLHNIRDGLMQCRSIVGKKTFTQLQRLNETYKTVRYFSSDYVEDLLSELPRDLDCDLMTSATHPTPSLFPLTSSAVVSSEFHC